ncbi:MAG: hypothetical protein K6E40_10050 [Desulfovibrio sp.]|nr:hypothetical protein [Desulfovibrio sp.]
MTPSFVYTAIFALTLASGEVVEAEGESYSTFEECQLQSEADSKLMAREWQFNFERTGEQDFYRAVEPRCERHEVARHGKTSR